MCKTVSQGAKTSRTAKCGQRGLPLSSSTMHSVPLPYPPTHSREVNVAEPPPPCPPSPRSPGTLIPHQPSCRGHHTQIMIDNSALNPDWLRAAVTSQWESFCEWISMEQTGREREREGETVREYWFVSTHRKRMRCPEVSPVFDCVCVCV